jgi:AcrR family transcriptional regulator
MGRNAKPVTTGERILTAAAEVFNERGLEVSLDEVARHAGVGVGTVYRRFASKEMEKTMRQSVRRHFSFLISHLALRPCRCICLGASVSVHLHVHAQRVNNSHIYNR